MATFKLEGNKVFKHWTGSDGKAKRIELSGTAAEKARAKLGGEPATEKPAKAEKSEKSTKVEKESKGSTGELVAGVLVGLCVVGAGVVGLVLHARKAAAHG